MAKVDLIVSVDREHRDHVAEVADRLRASGMDVKQEMKALGAITGAIDPEKVPQVSKVKGVLRVSQPRQVRAL